MTLAIAVHCVFKKASIFVPHLPLFKCTFLAVWPLSNKLKGSHTTSQVTIAFLFSDINSYQSSTELHSLLAVSWINKWSVQRKKCARKIASVSRQVRKRSGKAYQCSSMEKSKVSSIIKFLINTSKVNCIAKEIAEDKLHDRYSSLIFTKLEIESIQ